MAGRVMISAKIGPNGEVSSADASSNTGLSQQVVQCLLRKVRNAQFDAPGPNGSTIQIPVTFVQQGK
jgi:TonB family protein